MEGLGHFLSTWNSALRITFVLLEIFHMNTWRDDLPIATFSLIWSLLNQHYQVIQNPHNLITTSSILVLLYLVNYLRKSPLHKKVTPLVFNFLAGRQKREQEKVKNKKQKPLRTYHNGTEWPKNKTARTKEPRSARAQWTAPQYPKVLKSTYYLITNFI